MNILIIGQGIAGSCLAWELKRRGSEFTVADRPVAETASRVAAGRMPGGGRSLLPGDGTGIGRVLVAENSDFPGSGDGGPV